MHDESDHQIGNVLFGEGLDEVSSQGHVQHVVECTQTVHVASVLLEKTRIQFHKINDTGYDFCL